jgi:hypothetical protein
VGWEEKDGGGASHEVPCAIVKAAEGSLKLTEDQTDKALKLALGQVLDPGERVIVDKPQSLCAGRYSPSS